MVQDLGGSGSKRRRSLDAEINLVPFIDLLSMCICFLLMTAVWIQTGVVEIKQSRGTSAPTQSGPFELSMNFINNSSAELILKKENKVARKAVVKPSENVSLLQAIEAEIKLWPIQDAKNTEVSLVSAAFIKPAEGVPYGSLVGALDLLRRQKITNLGVLPVGDTL